MDCIQFMGGLVVGATIIGLVVFCINFFGTPDKITPEQFEALMEIVHKNNYTIEWSGQWSDVVAGLRELAVEAGIVEETK